MKFQLSGAPSGAGPIRERNFGECRSSEARFRHPCPKNAPSIDRSMSYVIFPSKSENEVSG